MKSNTDKQTLSDLSIFPQDRYTLSIFDFFDKVQTRRGRDKLRDLLNKPLEKRKDILERLAVIQFLFEEKPNYKIDYESLDFIEYYLNNNIPMLHDNIIDSTFNWISNKIKPSNDYYIVSRAQDYIWDYLVNLNDFLEKQPFPDELTFFREIQFEVDRIYKSPDFNGLFSQKKKSYRQINHYDSLIRRKYRDNFTRLLDLTYLLDIYLSTAQIAEKHNLCFPQIAEEQNPYIKIEKCWHPLINEPVKNSIDTTADKNLCFITGANMSGKSTFLKTVGLCVFLAHVGFPVPADTMTTSFFNGIYTTINISDDLNRGYSHYYNEIKRVKEIALSIKANGSAFVIFDEMFRGTNVKDAYDATLLISKGFSGIKSSLFFISTHITEVCEELMKLPDIDFHCFKSKLINDKIIYDYKLVDGVSSERMGLTILKNEDILTIINEIISTDQNQSNSTTVIPDPPN